VRVLVVSVVNILVLVFQRFVVVFMHMTLSQVQPHAATVRRQMRGKWLSRHSSA
jgi:hypothetical protein